MFNLNVLKFWQTILRSPDTISAAEKGISNDVYTYAL